MYAGPTAYLEITNRGTCPWDAEGVFLFYQLACKEGIGVYRFPEGSTMLPGAVFRAVELFEGYLPNESSTPVRHGLTDRSIASSEAAGSCPGP